MEKESIFLLINEFVEYTTIIAVFKTYDDAVAANALLEFDPGMVIEEYYIGEIVSSDERALHRWECYNSAPGRYWRKYW